MATKSGFFMSVDGDRMYKAEFFAEYFASFIGNGVFPNPSTGLKAYTNNDMTIKISKGKAWINGYYFVNDNDFNLKIKPADGVLNRIDRVVLRWDLIKREIILDIKEGEFSSKPSAPQLQRDADIYELGLADIRVNKGIIRISQSDITDLRLNKELCGIVHGVIDQVDTTDLFIEYQNWIREKKQEYNRDIREYTREKQEELEGWFFNRKEDLNKSWNEWFANIQNILDENVAGNLLSEIQALDENLANTTTNLEKFQNFVLANNRENKKSIANLKNEIDNISMTLPYDADNYNSAVQWVDILIPDESRGKGILQILLNDKESNLEITSNKQAMAVIMEEENYNKTRQIPADYEQIIFKLGHKTEVGQYLSWVEEFLSDYKRGFDKLKAGLRFEDESLEITSNKYVMNIIMDGEDIEGLTNYRKEFVDVILYEKDKAKQREENSRLEEMIRLRR